MHLAGALCALTATHTHTHTYTHTHTHTRARGLYLSLSLSLSLSLLCPMWRVLLWCGGCGVVAVVLCAFASQAVFTKERRTDTNPFDGTSWLAAHHVACRAGGVY